MKKKVIDDSVMADYIKEMLKMEDIHLGVKVIIKILGHELDYLELQGLVK